MKTAFKSNLLKHLIAKKEEGGFTLIELLVVIIIIGILAAIALPSFLNQANKARQSEASTYVGSMNRAQQAHYLENGEFETEVLEDLELGIPATTEFYNYSVGDNTDGDTVGSVNRAQPWNEGAQDENSAVKAFIGLAYLGEDTAGNSTTLAKLCEANKAPVNDGADGAEAVPAGGECPDLYEGRNAADEEDEEPPAE